MRTLFLSLFLCSIAAKASAQLADGSTAPDWTMKDINGKVWHLYELTAKGKTVFIDVSATWCGPCWRYHNTRWLDSLWDEHGPNGTIDQSCYVFFIEGDPRTTSADLHGKGARSYGDWVSGTTFPIIDPGPDTISSFLTSYSIQYYPTVYMICPDNKIYKMGQVSHELLFERSQKGCAVPKKEKSKGKGGKNFRAGESLPAAALFTDPFILPQQTIRFKNKRGRR